MEEIATKAQTKLASIASLFQAMHENDIRYCHLKGNPQHLLLSFSGGSDIDVLFDPKQKVKLETLLNELGFKKFHAIRPKQLRDVVDFIALDEESGNIIHLHTYYALTIGEPYLRGYQVGIPDLILADRVLNEEFGTYCITPEYELTLLYLTEVLKLRHRDYLRMRFTNKIPISDKAKYQYSWLRQNTTAAGVEAAFKTIYENPPAVADLDSEFLSSSQIRKMAPLIKKESARYRLYSPSVALVLRWQRELATRLRRGLSQLLSWPISSARVNPRGGVVIAVFTPGASGKEKAILLLSEAFGKKLDVYRVTFESETDSAGAGHKVKAATIHRITSFIHDLKKSLKLKKVQHARNQGALVICHRFPENLIVCQDKTVVDSRSSGNSWKYARPDLVFKLVSGMTSPVPIDENTKNIYNGFVTAIRMVTIDADRPLSEVVGIMKKEIWSII